MARHAYKLFVETLSKDSFGFGFLNKLKSVLWNIVCFGQNVFGEGSG